jgi:hypothetical protein
MVEQYFWLSSVILILTVTVPTGIYYLFLPLFVCEQSVLSIARTADFPL